MNRVATVNREQSAAARREILAAALRGELEWAAAIRQFRHSLGMSQAKFGRTFGLVRSQVMALETGDANPTVRTLEKLGRPFGLVVGFVPLTQRLALPPQPDT